MTVAALSTAGLTQYVSASSNVSASQQAFQALQQSLAGGNLTAAKTAFASYQQLNQNSTGTTQAGTSSGTTASSSSQLSTDLASLASALNAGNLTSAQSAFATVQGDLKTSPSQSMGNAESAVAQTVQWVDDLLSLTSQTSDPTTQADPVTSILDSVFGLNPASSSTDPTTSILESAYGSGSDSNSASPQAPSLPTTGNAGSGASMNAYA